MPVLYEFSRDGIPLEEWIGKHKKSLHNMRIFYVIKSNSHLGIFKFGVAGFSRSQKTDAYGRLKSYVTQYGVHEHWNHCSGARLYYLLGSKKAPNVPRRKSMIYKLEQHIIKKLKPRLAKNRGRERIRYTLRLLTKYLTNSTLNQFSDEVVVPRRSNRKK